MAMPSPWATSPARSSASLPAWRSATGCSIGELSTGAADDRKTPCPWATWPALPCESTRGLLGWAGPIFMHGGQAMGRDREAFIASDGGGARKARPPPHDWRNPARNIYLQRRLGL